MFLQTFQSAPKSFQSVKNFFEEEVQALNEICDDSAWGLNESNDSMSEFFPQVVVDVFFWSNYFHVSDHKYSTTKQR